MLERLQKDKRWLAVAIICIVLLAVVRAYEDVLFYDPFLAYFKRDFSALPLPATDNSRLFLNYLFRYVLNTLLSLAVLYALFRDAGQLEFVSVVYAVFFILLTAVFFLAMFYFNENRMVLFYIRRFIIQPLFLLLFIPAFYFQERASGKK